jgi:hypothetical protein
MAPIAVRARLTKSLRFIEFLPLSFFCWWTFVGDVCWWSGVLDVLVVRSGVVDDLVLANREQWPRLMTVY